MRGQDPGTGPSEDRLVLGLLFRRGGGKEQRLPSHPLDDFNPLASAICDLGKISNVLICSKLSFRRSCELGGQRYGVAASCTPWELASVHGAASTHTRTAHAGVNF